MELDNLKEIWQSQPAGHADPGKLSELIRSQSGSSLGKMRRALRYELLVVIITWGGVILYYFFAMSKGVVNVAWTYLFLLGLFMVYYLRKDRLLKTMQCVTCEVKSNLSMHLSKLEKLLRIYLWAGTLGIPLVIIYFGILFYIRQPYYTPQNIFLHSPAFTWWQTALAWLTLALATTPLSYWLNKKYVYWLYGKHVKRLKDLIGEMEEGQG